jgi:hypothetical protein
MTQIVIDQFQNPEYNNLPRMGLYCCGIIKPLLASPLERDNLDKYIYSIPHLDIYRILYDGGEIDLLHVSFDLIISIHIHIHRSYKSFFVIYQADGMCFKRVVWGTGFRMHYADAMVVLRRLTAEFARGLVMHAYSIPIPPSIQVDISKVDEMSYSLIKRGRRLRVVIVSRGGAGLGRSLNNEKLIASHLKKEGASVTFFRESNQSKKHIDFQLQMFVQADVVSCDFAQKIKNIT